MIKLKYSEYYLGAAIGGLVLLLILGTVRLVRGNNVGRYRLFASDDVQPCSAQVQSTAGSNQDNVVVYITGPGANYHRHGCRYLSKSETPILLKYAKYRYTSCAVCNPPK